MPRNWKLALAPLSLWMLASLLAWIGFKLDDTGAKIFPYVTLLTRLALAAIKRAGGVVLCCLGGPVCIRSSTASSPGIS